ASDYFICNFVNEDQSSLVNMYLGYHETQVRKEGGGAGENSIHPPEHCLPGSGWDVIASDVVDIDFPALPPGPRGNTRAKRFVIAKGDQRQLVYFWYQSRGRVMAQSHDVILYRFLDRALRQRTDGTLVRITVPLVRGDVEEAERAFGEFTRAAAPLLPRFLPN
ncbi:MAG: EpsI family protein, partial [Proteobacteria bacterium]|nr:EpsI family protein [Pseudomonadota bacterium]